VTQLRPAYQGWPEHTQGTEAERASVPSRFTSRVACDPGDVSGSMYAGPEKLEGRTRAARGTGWVVQMLAVADDLAITTRVAGDNWMGAATVAGTKKTRRPSARPAALARALDEGRESLDFYLKEISRIPLLTVEEETALARRAFRGDVQAQEKLARHNVRFVVSVAKKFQNRGVPLMDLIGEGNVGLMTAARKFDPDRGVKFISYAVWWIRQAIQAAIARHGRPVRLPLNRTADLTRLGRTTTLLTEKLGRLPTTEELVTATGLTPEAVRSLGALHIEALRLDHPIREGEDRGRLERFVPLTQEGTDASTLANSRTSDLEAALAALPARDAKVLRLYFGLDDGNSRTLEEIGRMMGVTRERIRQLRDRALRQLKEEHGDKLRELAA
jgi:RNA polymerase primary sigma factor